MPAPSGPISAEHLAAIDVERQRRRRRDVAPNALDDAGDGDDRARRPWPPSAHLRGRAEIDFDRHAGLEDALAVVDGDLDAIDELGALVGGLHVARRELGARAMNETRPGEPIAGVGHDRRGLIELERGTSGSSTYTFAQA